MNAAILSLLGVSLTALVAAGTTLWRQRKTGPEASATFVTASVTLLEQLQTRIESLEVRVRYLEQDNARYRALYGPLPPPGSG